MLTRIVACYRSHVSTTFIAQFKARYERAVFEAFLEIACNSADITLKDLANVLKTPCGRVLAQVRLGAFIPLPSPPHSLPAPPPSVLPRAELGIARHLLSVAGTSDVVQSTRQAIACAIPTSREAVSMVLTGWKRAGVVEFHGKNIRLLDRVALSTIAGA